MTLYFWEGKLLFRNGILAKDVRCCCGDGGPCFCCGSVSYATITVDASGCSLDGYSSKEVATGEDDWTWSFGAPWADDCESTYLDYAEFNLICVDGLYQLTLYVYRTQGTDTVCVAKACETVRNCFSNEGFLLEFTMECTDCCSNDFTVTVEEHKVTGP